ncbi:hypothetical protein [Longimicrobium sp.]|uniref:hypothetical protein n=1 Tax=Longimicrobium sp. TaxID=2029185 RepID=UPI003B3B264C
MSAPDGGPGRAGTGTHQDLGVTVQRDLTGSGRLARGGESRFSSLRLRSVGRPASPAEAENGADAAPSLAAAEVAEEPEPPSAPAPSPLRRLLRWLGLG